MQNEKIGSTIRDIAKAFMILQSIASIILGIILCVILGKNNLGEVGIISLVVIACGGKVVCIRGKYYYGRIWAAC